MNIVDTIKADIESKIKNGQLIADAIDARSQYHSAITVEQWCDESLFPRYFANRNEEQRMGKSHLKDLTSSKQSEVSATYNVVTKQLVKIDGHSRAHAWKKNLMEKPSSLLLKVHVVKDSVKVEELYRVYTSKAAAANSKEEQQHVNALTGFTPKSKVLDKSLKMVAKLLRAGSVGDLISKYRKELEVVDSWQLGYSKKKYKVLVAGEFNRKYAYGTIASMLATLRDHPTKAPTFWSDFNSESPKIVAVREYIDSLRISETDVLPATRAGIALGITSSMKTVSLK